jgi:hypothetical protein
MECILVNFVRKFENIFEKYIEGFFNKRFSSGLQPVEIAKQLSKEMENQRSVGIANIYVPNSYSVYIRREDYDRIAPYRQAIVEELTVYLTTEAKRKEYTIVGKTVIDILLDEAISQGIFRVSSHFTEPLPLDMQSTDNTGMEELSDTRVFGKATLPVQQQPSLAGLLTILEGLDSGIKIDITIGRINIGRRETNELPLSDMNTSRLHAYLVYETGSHVLHDAKSLNGTYVNGHRITRKKLQTGDRIKVGNTIILYEVK